MRPPSTPSSRPMPLPPFEAALRRMLLARHGTGIASSSGEIERLLADWPPAQPIGED